MMAAVLVVSSAAGVLLIKLVGVLAALLLCAVGAVLIWVSLAVTFPSRPPYRWATSRPGPGSGPAACALCGFNCIGGGFWTPVPGFPDHVMHTMGCGPNLPGEEPLAAPTHRRIEGGRYEPL